LWLIVGGFTSFQSIDFGSVNSKILDHRRAKKADETLLDWKMGNLPAHSGPAFGNSACFIE
jgi:hypothetical protein